VPAGKVAVGDAPSGITSRTSEATKSLSVPTCWVDPKDTRMAEGDRVPYSGARLRVSLSQRDDTFGSREG
jgi:hypothetical protein